LKEGNILKKGTEEAATGIVAWKSLKLLQNGNCHAR